MLKSASKAPPTSSTSREEATAKWKMQRKWLSLAASICFCLQQAAMPRKGRRHPRSPPHSAPNSFVVGAAVQVLDLSLYPTVRTSAGSSALAAKLVARVFRAASRARRKRNSPTTHRGARAALCPKASPLAAVTGDAGGSGSPSTLRVTAGLVSATVSTAESSTLNTQATLPRVAKLDCWLVASKLRLPQLRAPNLLATSRASKWSSLGVSSAICAICAICASVAQIGSCLVFRLIEHAESTLLLPLQ